MEGTSSPTIKLAKTLGLSVYEAPEVCEICDGTEGPMIEWLGVGAHEECLPGHWRRDRAELEDYMAEVEWRRGRRQSAWEIANPQ